MKSIFFNFFKFAKSQIHVFWALLSLQKCNWYFLAFFSLQNIKNFSLFFGSFSHWERAQHPADRNSQKNNEKLGANRQQNKKKARKPICRRKNAFQSDLNP